MRFQARISRIWFRALKCNKLYFVRNLMKRGGVSQCRSPVDGPHDRRVSRFSLLLLLLSLSLSLPYIYI